MQNTADGIQPDRQPGLVVVGIGFGEGVLVLWPDNGVILVAEVFKAICQRLVWQPFGLSFMGQQLLNLLLSLLFVTPSASNTAQEGFAAAFAVQQLELTP
jgi:hypothetical protein